MSFLDLCPFVSKIRLAFELDMSSQQTPPFGKGSSSLLQKNKRRTKWQQRSPFDFTYTHIDYNTMTKFSLGADENEEIPDIMSIIKSKQETINNARKRRQREDRARNMPTTRWLGRWLDSLSAGIARGCARGVSDGLQIAICEH